MEKHVTVRIGLTGFELKMIALVTMLIDHIAAGGLVSYTEQNTAYMTMRLVGRLAFPIFAFLLAEGARKTGNIRRYALRLLAFALISEVPFDLLFHGMPFSFLGQNIYFTLFLGLLAIAIFRYANTRWKKSALSLIGAGSVLLMMLAADLLSTDYGSVGVLFIFGMYIWLSEGRPLVHGLFIMVIFGSMWWGSLQLAALLAFLPMFLYNGEKGTRLGKYWFYGFYPAHILILYLIKETFFGIMLI